MWYFSWILGSALACSFAILCGLWFELSLPNQVLHSEDK
jgi:cyd operon protein YbgT